MKNILRLIIIDTLKLYRRYLSPFMVKAKINSLKWSNENNSSVKVNSSFPTVWCGSIFEPPFSRSAGQTDIKTKMQLY